MTMFSGLSFSDLIDYTDWQRAKWHDWFRQHGDQILETGAGPHGDGRFQNVGDLVRHIFSAEKRYIDKLSNRPITDTSSISNKSAELLFQFGRQSRANLLEFIEACPAQDWEIPQEFNIMNNVFQATPRKIVAHMLIHEIRHWAQIGTLLRLSGFPAELHDFLFAPVLGEQIKLGAR